MHPSFLRRVSHLRSRTREDARSKGTLFDECQRGAGLPIQQAMPKCKASTGREMTRFPFRLRIRPEEGRRFKMRRKCINCTGGSDALVSCGTFLLIRTDMNGTAVSWAKKILLQLSYRAHPDFLFLACRQGLLRLCTNDAIDHTTKNMCEVSFCTCVAFYMPSKFDHSHRLGLDSCANSNMNRSMWAIHSFNGRHEQKNESFRNK